MINSVKKNPVGFEINICPNTTFEMYKLTHRLGDTW